MAGEVYGSGAGDECMSSPRGEEIFPALNRKFGEVSVSNHGGAGRSAGFLSADSFKIDPQKKSLDSSSTKSTSWGSTRTPESVYSGERKGSIANSSPASVNSKQVVGNGLLDDQDEHIRYAQIGRKKNFSHMEKIKGKATNVLQGLELHTGVFDAKQQKEIVECVYNLQRMGQKGQLRARTYTEPRKWMRGKGRVTIQFGCCYNYAKDKYGNDPGIIRDEDVDPLPPLFKEMIKKMVRLHVLPPTCIPNSCIVNIYDEGDCIPPHIDHHHFLRPFCTVSFLAQCNILFGSNLKIVGEGEFAGPVSTPLPLGSVLILNGNGADIAKHCVPAVPARRISITFRKMDDSKLPFNFVPDPELQRIRPLVYNPSIKSPVQQNHHDDVKKVEPRTVAAIRPLAYSPLINSPVQQNHRETNGVAPQTVAGTSNVSHFTDNDDFPPLGSSNSLNRKRDNRNAPKPWIK
ncbi:hypothetical protein RJ640_002349 [Escallonia rubra]|uniref:Fe2OG dioxygenase domain-containing protein n=1 Tax=Escallonia rubra TaxID=112253 RepID=A0AA88QL34_9ASTE|nr:hypothetical protein RJ640_002349 [Escallonia rubra]